MDSKVKLLGHPVHQMLIVFPLGLLGIAVVFDLIHVATNNPTMALVAYWMIVAGVLAGLIAAPFGTIDWLAIPKGTRAKTIGALHGTGNVVVLLLFIGSWWLRGDESIAPPMSATVLSTAGALLALVTGWLGGELVDRLGVGVHDGAHLDAPSSLTHKTPR